MKTRWTVNAIFLAQCGLAFAQQATPSPTSLAKLLSDAARENSQIAVAEDGWKAATHVAAQVSALPDPKFNFQSFSVGSPKPGAGFNNSDFAYLGFGASQELPFPGKLKLKGETAKREAETQQASCWTSTSRV